MFHTIGSVLGNLGLAVFGSTLGKDFLAFLLLLTSNSVLSNYRYDAKSTVDALIRHQCTHLLAVPTILLDMMELIEKDKVEINSLKSVHLAGTLVPSHVIVKFNSLVQSLRRVQIIYGTTETNAISGATFLTNSSLTSLDNVGCPVESVEVKIVDRLTKRTARIGEEGEVMVRGPNVFMGYYRDPMMTEKAIDKEGWYNTG